jgi:hypothetical protein
MKSNMFVGRLFGLGLATVLFWLLFGPLVKVLYSFLPVLVVGALLVAFLHASNPSPKDNNERKIEHR